MFYCFLLVHLSQLIWRIIDINFVISDIVLSLLMLFQIIVGKINFHDFYNTYPFIKTLKIRKNKNFNDMFLFNKNFLVISKNLYKNLQNQKK